MTLSLTAIARPYARAAFEYALAENNLSQWEKTLQEAALIVLNPSVTKLLSMPGIDRNQLAEFFCDILSDQLNEARKNFIFLLAEKNRLSALPEMAELFKQYKAEQEKMLDVQVVSATSLDAAYKQKLSTALSARFGRQIALDCKVDPNLLGGAIIHAGDTVIDGSIRGKLNRLLESF